MIHQVKASLAESIQAFWPVFLAVIGCAFWVGTVSQKQEHSITRIESAVDPLDARLERIEKLLDAHLESHITFDLVHRLNGGE